MTAKAECLKSESSYVFSQGFIVLILAFLSPTCDQTWGGVPKKVHTTDFLLKNSNVAVVLISDIQWFSHLVVVLNYMYVFVCLFLWLQCFSCHFCPTNFWVLVISIEVSILKTALHIWNLVLAIFFEIFTIFVYLICIYVCIWNKIFYAFSVRVTRMAVKRGCLRFELSRWAQFFLYLLTTLWLVTKQTVSKQVFLTDFLLKKQWFCRYIDFRLTEI